MDCIKASLINKKKLWGASPRRRSTPSETSSMESISQPCIHLPLLRSYNLECFVTHSPKCSVGSSEHLISLTLMLNSPSFPLYSCGIRTKAVLFLVELSQSPWTHKTQIEAMHSSGKTIKHRRSYNGWEPESTIVVGVQRRKPLCTFPLEPLKVMNHHIWKWGPCVTERDSLIS